MRKAKVVLAATVALIAIAIGPRALYAQSGGVPVDQVHPNSTLVALVDVPVRDQAPGGGALYVKGQQIGTLRPREAIRVSEEQIVSTLLGNQKWVRFSRNEKPSNGWVLVGTVGTTSNVFKEAR